MFEENPNEATRPDFATIEHQEACQQLVDEGLSEEQAACSLTALWTLKNNADKVRWAEKQECLENLRRGEEEENKQRQQALRDEEEAARLEEHKKNKSKYAPLIQAKVPSDPTIIPVKARNDGWVRARPDVSSTVLLWTRDMTRPKGIATEKRFLCSRGESWAGLWSG
jgi:hypothetical protein